MSKKKHVEIPKFNFPIIETHCHLDYLEQEQLEQTLTQSESVGIERIITIAVSADNLAKVRALVDGSEYLWGTQGIHPHQAAEYQDSVEKEIVSSLAHPRILAVGEIGLDYFYDHCDRDVQKTVFSRQLEIAIEHNLPVVIHTREADEDTIDILKEYAPQMQKKGVIHSFTSSLGLAEFCLDQGFYLGFNGISTFNKAENVREVISHTPLNRILLETDAPYLTPVPYRGKTNAPFYLPFIAQKVADVKELPIDTLLKAAYQNSIDCFFTE